ncbi:putative cell wall-binding protein [Evansella vedderi]|uniref:Cell wall-binding protein n=1 Tax=Evansella vedderi TaxID=38282 RepID=A0ABT9ZTC8_9BACI|nr:S8 family serine peptidase [Evansella vedderi]MDQ0254449.1 putative cell wall-binding protein [Evansella vedderi]
MRRDKMHPRFIGFMIFITVFLSLPPFSFAEKSSPLKEVIVIYENELGKEFIHLHAEEILHRFQAISAASITIEEDKLDYLVNNENIVAVEDNSPVQLSNVTYHFSPSVNIGFTNTGSLPEPIETQWNLEVVNPTAAWEEGYIGKDIKVAIIDTGISAHPHLTVAGGVSTLSYTDSWKDDNGHGTHVAGTVGANEIFGVAPGTSLYAVKALDQDGTGTLSSILTAIDWSIANNMNIINLSFGTETESYVLKEILDHAYELGILIVAAAGNSGKEDGSGNNVYYPAKFDSVIAVSAIDQELKRASFSSTGDEVEFTAPGVDILSTYLNGELAMASGTSFAAPHVTGFLALLKEKYPTKTNGQLREVLQKYVMDLGTPGRDRLYGYGLVTYTGKEVPQLSRIGGVNLYETSALISQEGWDQSEVVILARGDRFSDALAGVPLAKKYDAPLILTRNNRLDPFTKKELERLGANKVIILGGHLAVDPTVEKSIKEQLNIEVRRVAGANLHVTAELISQEVAPKGSDVAIIVSDSRFQDALSVASFAGVEQIPILLANTSSLPIATERALKELGVKETLVIGGELAISHEVFEKLPNPKRIAGLTRYDTNIEVLNYFNPNFNKAFIATSHRFQDGLSGAALAAKDNSGVILVGDNVRDVTRAHLLSTRYHHLRVLGGELAISPSVYEEIEKIVE